jgi:L-lactate dehydrogenase (cytochrome)
MPNPPTPAVTRAVPRVQAGARRLKRILSLADFAPVARRRLPRGLYGFIEGGAEDGVSMLRNRAAFDQVAFLPRTLIDTSTRNTAVQIFGREWAAPFGIAPMGAAGIAAFQADLALARAASQAGIPFVLSGSSLVAMERVMRENPSAWFQAYLSVDRADNDTLIRRVASNGFQTLVITVDVPVAGNREDNIRNGYSSPLRPSLRLALDGLLHPRWLVGTFMRSLASEGMPHFENLAAARVPMMSLRATRAHRRDNLCWDDLKRLREQWKHRLVLKGLLSAADVQLAREHGVDAVIVSNHGGRQLDGAVAPLRVLPEIAAIAGPVTVLYDSGVRRGTDVLKALALGASMVFVGRPFLYAAVAGGVAGVRHAIELLRSEVDRDMALLGCTDFGDLRSRLMHPW